MTVYRYSLLSCLAVAFLFVGGCFMLPSKGYQKQWYYMIEVERTGDELTAVPESILVVRPFSISPACEGKSFVIRRAEGEYESTYYHQFFITPSRNMSQVAEQWIADSGLFDQVSPTSSLVMPNYALEGRVRKLYGDVSVENNPTAVVEVNFSLVSLTDADPQTIFQKTYKQKIVLEEKHPQDLPGGVNKAYAVILSDLEKDLEVALSKK